jgi:hypothetical protein
MASGFHAVQNSIGGSLIATFRQLAPLIARWTAMRKTKPAKQIA